MQTKCEMKNNFSNNSKRYALRIILENEFKHKF